MLIEIHMLKNFAPTNLNRDDTGSPKSCYFGGVQRGRISSQCLKRSWRTSPVLQKAVGKDNFGIRTRKLPELVADELKARGVGEDFVEAALCKISGFGNKDGKENKDGNYTAQIAFYSHQDIQAIANLVQKEMDEAVNIKSFSDMNVKEWQKKLDDVKIRPITLDIALFGRMVTSDAFSDVEASMQVAHAISTHRVSMESDFFTAVDDMISGDSNDDLGAAMMGDVDFNSCCYYIYASIDTDQLKANLKNSPDSDELIHKTIPALVETLAFSNPSGKQNTFAGNALPDAVLIECKSKKIALSYANAFVKPAVATRDKDLVDSSISKLIEEVKTVQKDFDLPVDKRMWFCSGRYSDKNYAVIGAKSESFRSLIEGLNDFLPQEF